MTAYNLARAAEGPQKGMTYEELLVDNIFGLDNDYLSAGEGLKQAIKSDPLGFLQNAGISAYEGAKQAVTQPLTTAEALLSGMYDSGVDVASTLGPDPAYLNNALQEMYGVTYDEATDEQVTRAREALFGDVLNVAGVVPGVGAAAKGIASLPNAVKGAANAIDTAQRAQFQRVISENTPVQDVSSLAGRQFYDPNNVELRRMQSGTLTSQEADYWNKLAMADKMRAQGVSDETIANTVGILRLPRVDLKGNPLSPRSVNDPGYRETFAATPTEMGTLRPDRLNDYGFNIFDDPTLGVFSGSFNSRSTPPTIRLNPNQSAQAKAETKAHEMAHGDDLISGIPSGERGTDPDVVMHQKFDAISALEKDIKAEKNPTVKRMLKDRLSALKRQTSYELYEANPGEMLARLSSGETTMARRLTPFQVLNPYLLPKNSPVQRGIMALNTAAFSETNPVMRRLLDYGYLSRADTRDYHVGVPMDVSKAVTGTYSAKSKP
jgi:hypothetical protein